MKYKQLGVIVAFCFASWLVISYIVFNEDPLWKVEDQEKKGSLLKYIEELESQINHQKELHKVLAENFDRLKQNPRSPPERVNDLKNMLASLGQLTTHNAELKIPAKENLSLNGKPVLPTLVFSCNRPDVRRNLDGLLKYRPNHEQFPIIVSQDCAHSTTAEIIRSYGSQVTHIQQPDQSEPDVPPGELKFKGYFKIARHYRWGLHQIFRKFNYTAVIIVEDDLDIAPDFYSYFSATYDLLLKDPTIWCISAWNDNGKASLVDMPQGSDILYRSDFFPGLGWMITKDLWDELEPKWPRSYWDDWMRRPEQRKDRACIRPEISRTRTFGKIGVSNGLFFDKHLKYIKLNENSIDFSSRNLSYLMQSQYDKQFVDMVYSLPVVTATDVRTNANLPDIGSVRITYRTKDAYKSAAKLLGLMDDFKSGVPRTGYRGIVSFFYKDRRVYLAPNANWKGYDLTWN